MLMKNSTVLIGLMALVCVSCSNVKETPKGFHYTVARKGDGVLAKPGQFLIMNMAFKDGKDSVWNDSRQGEPMIVMIQDTAAIKMEEGIDEIFRMLSKGDSVHFKIPSNTLFEKTFHQALPPSIDPKSEFTFDMGVRDIFDRDQVMKMQEQIVAKQNEKFIKEQQEQLKKDIVKIEDYLKTNKVEAMVDSSGLRYVITKTGQGPKPGASDTVVVTYSGKLMDTGVEFDKSAAPVTFQLTNLIKGWQIGFPLLNVGSKATLYVPSVLAYGRRGYPSRIPENANLIFEVELIKIK
jgi:FKBP-type peptidyl-prolyl cis-trans isomerase FkpA